MSAILNHAWLCSKYECVCMSGVRGLLIEYNIVIHTLLKASQLDRETCGAHSLVSLEYGERQKERQGEWLVECGVMVICGGRHTSFDPNRKQCFGVLVWLSVSSWQFVGKQAHFEHKLFDT